MFYFRRVLFLTLLHCSVNIFGFQDFQKRVSMIQARTWSGQNSSVTEKLTVLEHRIYGGSTYEHGDFPWMAVIFKYNKKQEPEFVGAGTLISESKIVTAAHSIHGNRDSPPTEDFLIMLGGHDLNKKFEIGRSFVSPRRIVVHKDWSTEDATADADIAMIELKDNVQFSEYIQPVKMWELDIDMPVSHGVIIGYGLIDNKGKSHESIPRKLNVTIYSNEECFLEYPNLAEFSSKRTLCVGSVGNSGPCLGDSGSGMFVKIDGVFYLRGLISTAIQSADGSCDTSKHVIYTNIHKFKSWIRDYTDDADEFRQNTLYCSRVDHSEVNTSEIFPWIARIQNTEKSLLKHGVLITDRLVLTSISAVAQWSDILKKWIPVKLSNLKIYVGMQVTTANDPIKIDLHRKFNFTRKLQKHSNAHVTLRNPITFTKNVHPICLLAPGFDFATISNARMYKAATESFGMRSMNVGARNDELNVLDKSLCRNDFANDTELQEDIFCLQGTDSEALCGNDMPLFVKHHGKWYLRGIALPGDDDSCFNVKSVVMENIDGNLL